jgi:GNAT superfamily N-acetyltransferase
MMKVATALDEVPVVEVLDRRGLLLPRVALRPLARGETQPLQRVFDGMSPMSRRMRYLTGLPFLTPSMLTQLADVDHDRHGCWVASVGDDPVAIGHYSRPADDPAVAEIALEVVDRYQGHGLGRLLVDVLGAAAADVGVTSLVWVIDEANLRARHLAVALGGRFTTSSGVVDGITDLPQVPAGEAATIAWCARAARQGVVQGSAA